MSGEAIFFLLPKHWTSLSRRVRFLQENSHERERKKTTNQMHFSYVRTIFFDYINYKVP